MIQLVNNSAVKGTSGVPPKIGCRRRRRKQATGGHDVHECAAEGSVARPIHNLLLLLLLLLYCSHEKHTRRETDRQICTRCEDNFGRLCVRLIVASLLLLLELCCCCCC